jgi:hypothetical protein
VLFRIQRWWPTTMAATRASCLKARKGSLADESALELS